MWLLHFLPDSIMIFGVHSLILLGIIAGLVGAFAYKIPQVEGYGLLIKVAGGVIFCTGLYLEGVYNANSYYKTQIADMQQELKFAQERSDQLNKELTAIIKQKNQNIKDTQDALQKELKKDSEKMDKNCTVDTSAIDILNKAAKTVNGDIK